MPAVMIVGAVPGLGRRVRVRLLPDEDAVLQAGTAFVIGGRASAESPIFRQIHDVFTSRVWNISDNIWNFKKTCGQPDLARS
jgi:hypothetical protein